MSGRWAGEEGSALNPSLCGGVSWEGGPQYAPAQALPGRAAVWKVRASITGRGVLRGCSA